MEKFLLLPALLATWYLSSAINAVQSQKFVSSAAFQDTTVGHDGLTILALTIAQLAFGFILSAAIVSIVTCLRKGNRISREDFKLSAKISLAEWIVATFHFIGSYSTNCGFMFGKSASLVQIVKLLEPVETLLIRAVANVCIHKSPHGITAPMLLATISMVFGTSMALSRKNLDGNPSTLAVVCALISGLALSLRNVGKKTLEALNSTSRSDDHKYFIVENIAHFGRLSLLATIVSLWLLLLISAVSIILGKLSGIVLLFSYIITIFISWPRLTTFHGVYNMASLGVLGLVDTQPHALLNVGKRLFNIVASNLFLGEQFTSRAVVGILLATCGGLIYATRNILTKYRCCHGMNSFCVIVFLALVGTSAPYSIHTLSHTSVDTTWRAKAIRSSFREACIEDIQDRIVRTVSPLIKESTTAGAQTVLIDPAYHGNTGDNMIAFGEIILLQELGLNVSECGIIQSQGKNPGCSDFTQYSESTTFFWHGGGNWGDLYQVVHSKRMESFAHLAARNGTVIGMPQSFHYNDKQRIKSDARKMEASLMDIRNKVTFLWRQKNSYLDGVREYSFCSNILIPDIAFMMGPLQGFSENDVKIDILFFLRADGESTIQGHETVMDLISSNVTWAQTDILELPKKRFRNTSISKTSARSRHVDLNQKIGIAVDKFAEAKVIVTDRLHASILAFLMGKPHVVIDQMYGKIHKTRETAFESSVNCRRRETMEYIEVDSLPAAVNAAMAVLEDLRS